MTALDFRPPRITPAFRKTAAAARRIVQVIVLDSLVEAKTVARGWRKAKAAGQLVDVRRYTRKVRAGGGCVTLFVVVVSLHAPKPLLEGGGMDALLEGVSAARARAYIAKHARGGL